MNIKQLILLSTLFSLVITQTVLRADEQKTTPEALAVEYFHIMAQRDMRQFVGVLARLLKNNIRECGPLAISPRFWRRVWTICFSNERERTGAGKIEKLCQEFPRLTQFKEQIDTISVDHWKINQENYELFKQLKKEQPELLLILIAPMAHEWLERVKKTKPEISEIFEEFYIPDSQNNSQQFTELLAQRNLSSKQVLVILEDKQQAEDEARSAGAASIVRYTTHQSLNETLKEYGINPTPL